MRLALANDYLLPTIQLVQQVGEETVEQISQQMGIDLKSKEQSLGDVLLDRGEITLLQAVQSYGIFANQGMWVGLNNVRTNSKNEIKPLSPVVILELNDGPRDILNQEEAYVAEFETIYRPVINPQLAYLITDVLSDEPARWPSLGHPNLLEIGRPVAAKLGRVEDGEEAWSIGYTPQLVVGVWLGDTGEQSQNGGKPIPTGLPAALWHAVIQYASHDLSPEGWKVPAGISQLDVCDPSGMLPTSECPNIVREVFLVGTEPTQPDSLYRRVKINRETGRLATVSTPPELVEEHVYLMVPSQAMEWAQLAGLTTPPEAFDVIVDAPGTSPEAQILSPQIFSHVKGKVAIKGSADGDHFAYYRLQVGKGLNPKDWLQVGEQTTHPVREDTLGYWNTEGLSGLYALQLMVVGTDQRVESKVIQVTVDNQAPTIHIRYPEEGQEIARTSPTIVFQVEAEDDLNLENVQFYLDGRLIGSISESPYSLPWRAEAGEHHLRVRALDRAGNISEEMVKFSVIQ